MSSVRIPTAAMVAPSRNKETAPKEVSVSMKRAVSQLISASVMLVATPMNHKMPLTRTRSETDSETDSPRLPASRLLTGGHA